MGLLHHLKTSALAVFIILGSVATAISPPACQSAAPSQTTLSGVLTTEVAVPGSPFGVVYATQQKNIAFVVLGDAANSSLGVLDTSAFAPTLLHSISFPAAYTTDEGPLGIALSHDGQYVFVAAGPGAVVFSAAKAAAGAANAVVGTLNGTTTSQNPGMSAIEVSLPLNDQYAFISQEYGSTNGDIGNVDVIRLNTTAKGGVSGTPIGFLSLGVAVVGTALSPDGTTLYATSEVVNATTQQGSLAVINVTSLETNPSTALVAQALAGCNPVRVIVSSDGKTVWVTARASNHLLAFDAAKLVSDPQNAIVASVQVGTAPVGLVFAKNETRILTANSNRFDTAGATSSLSVVNVTAALAGNPALLGDIPAGSFPREFAVSPDGGTILVSDYGSSQVQTVNVSTLP